MKQGELWGFIDPQGKWTIMPTFEKTALSFSEGLARAKQGEFWGFIDKEGNWVIAPQHELVFDFREGLAESLYKSRWGFIDKQGQWVIEPQFKGVTTFSDGLACARRHHNWGFIEKQGKWVIRPRFGGSCSFYDGLAFARSCYPPSLKSIVVFDSSMQGDLESGEPYAVLDELECFARKLTPIGRTLSGLFGSDKVRSRQWVERVEDGSFDD